MPCCEKVAVACWGCYEFRSSPEGTSQCSPGRRPSSRCRPENLTPVGRLGEARCWLGRPEHQLLPLTSACSAVPGTWQGAGEGHLTACGGAGTRGGVGCSNQAHPGPTLRKPTVPRSSYKPSWDKCDLKKKKKSLNRGMGERERRGRDDLCPRDYEELQRQRVSSWFLKIRKKRGRQ